MSEPSIKDIANHNVKDKLSEIFKELTNQGLAIIKEVTIVVHGRNKPEDCFVWRATAMLSSCTFSAEEFFNYLDTLKHLDLEDKQHLRYRVNKLQIINAERNIYLRMIDDL